MALQRPHPRAEEIISAIIGIPAHKIWPSRYDFDGVRLRPQPSKNYNSHTVSQCHRQKAKIAWTGRKNGKNKADKLTLDLVTLMESDPAVDFRGGLWCFIH